MSSVDLPRRRAVWLFLQVSAAVLPALTAARLRFEMDKAGLDALEGRVFVSYVGPYVLLWTLLLGLRLMPSPSGGGPMISSRVRGALLFTSAALGLWLLEPPNMSVPLSAWWSLLFWLVALAAPLGFLAHRSRGAGFSLLRTISILGGGAAVASVLALAMAAALVLPSISMGVPMVVGGFVFASGLALLRSGSTGSVYARALLSLGTLALVAQGFVALQISRPSYEMSYVTGIVDLDPVGGRVLVQLERLSIPVAGFAEIDLRTGDATELPRSTFDAAYAGGTRVELRRSALGVVLEMNTGQRLCHQVGETTQCGERLPGSDRYLLSTHPRAPRAIVTRGDRTEVRDFETGQSWTNTEDRGWIRWPCFAEEDRLLWRVDRGSVPFQQLAMSLGPEGGAPMDLAPGHELQCLGRSKVAPEVRFIRGRRRDNRVSRLEGPGLPESGLDLGFSVLVASWSEDGRVLGLLHEKGWFQRFSLGQGFSEPILLGPSEPPVLNADGSRFSYVVDRGPGTAEVLIRSLPAGEILGRFPVQVAVTSWDGEGGTLLVQSWVLRRFDPSTGEISDLFPPSASPD